MYTITKTIEFDAAHRVPHHKSKCFNLHGHRYRVEATAVGNVDINDRLGSDQGMVVDFGDLKRVMVECIHDVYDHGAIFYENDPNIVLWRLLRDAHSMNVHFMDKIPTAENLAELFFDLMWHHELHVAQVDWTLTEVAVWETPTSKAVYRIS